MAIRAWAWVALAAAAVFPARAADAGGAELALRLGLRRLAFERASAAVEALDPGAERDRAFLVAAAAKEGEGSPEALLAWLSAVVAPPPASDWFRGRALCALGRPAEAAGLLKDLLSRLEDDDPLRASVAADCARALSLSGEDREAALVLPRGGPGGGADASVFALAAGIDAGREPPDDVPDSLRALACAAAAVLRARVGSGPPPDEALALAARAVSLAADDPPALSECRGVELGLLAAAGRSKDAVDAARHFGGTAGEYAGRPVARSARPRFRSRRRLGRRRRRRRGGRRRRRRGRSPAGGGAPRARGRPSGRRLRASARRARRGRPGRALHAVRPAFGGVPRGGAFPGGPGRVRTRRRRRPRFGRGARSRR